MGEEMALCTYLSVRGAKKVGNMMSEKKAMPVVSKVIGVMREAKP